MDVLCVGMYRSASTWQYNVACHLLERQRGAQRLGFLVGEGIAALPPPSQNRWRVLKTHDPHDLLAAYLANSRALGLHSFRDARDVYVSLLRMWGDVGVTRQLLVQALVADSFWRRQPGVVVQRYEAIMADPAAAVAQIAAHLDIRLTADEVAAIAVEFSLEANRRRTAEIAQRLRQAGFNFEDPQGVQRYDSHTLLHWNHIDEGRIGGWRSAATPDDLAWLGRTCGDWLIANGYEADVLWANAPAPGDRMLG